MRMLKKGEKRNDDDDGSSVCGLFVVYCCFVESV